ncbi:anaerobic ribonucleoside reductase large subunit [Vibrio phage River4]|uniref:Uncharacterized protein n=1 Tax=Vibrio phage River4 TaxID=2736288 RepID=A0A6M9Z0W7_9CAUD|nr:anaerobic ribonucleoside reductase large subunit [Vibrio phage River4]QKN84737.1 hypothetical protein RIVER4_75 [Vibrio phage River4]
MIIIKRDNTRQAFNLHKPYEAAFMAASDAGYDYSDASQIANDTTQLVIHRLQAEAREEVSVYEIEQLVEDTLMSSCWKDVARKYIEYRHDRQQARDLESDLHKNIVGLVDQTNPDILHENANKESTVFHVQRDLLAGEISRHYALNYLLPREVAREHIAGNIHFHDLDYFPMMGMTNCCLVDLEGMLKNGFKMGNAQIESPNSIQTAATVVSQIAAAVASSQYGGTSFDRLDEVLAPYVTKTYDKLYEAEKAKMVRTLTKMGLPVDDVKVIQCAADNAMEITEKAVFDACQTLEYQVNTIYSTNGQTPFLTFGFGMGESWEAKLVQKGILQNRIAGLGKDRTTPVFPKLVFGLRDGLNLKPEDPNYDVKQLALECATKRMYPDILNYDKTVEITGGYKAPMGCRSFLSTWYDENGKETYSGRNNLGVVSLNIPKIALEAQLDYDKFWDLLDNYCEVAHRALQYRLERLSTVKAKSAPIMYMEGALGLHLDGEELVLPHLLKRGASISLGYIGLEEAANAMLGSMIHTYDEPEKQQFALDIVKFLDKKATQWKESEGIGYSIYATPSESLCNRFCKAIVREYGEFEGVTDKGYLTNSFHLDVLKKVNPYDKIDFEAQFIPYSSGGHICYGEFPNMRHNIEALENVWDYSYTRVPYYGTNTPIDECYECSFKGEFNCTSKGFECPNCGNHEPDKCSVTRRVCGYLGNPGTRPFNAGKQSEMTKRVKHL